MEMKEMRELTPEELDQKEKELRQEIFNLRFQLMSDQTSNPQRMKAVRREIARIKTVLREKSSQPADGPAPAR